MNRSTTESTKEKNGAVRLSEYKMSSHQRSFNPVQSSHHHAPHPIYPSISIKTSRRTLVLKTRSAQTAAHSTRAHFLFQAFKPEKRSTPRHSAHFASSPLKRRRSPFGRSRSSHKSDQYDASARNETTLVDEYHQDADDPNSGEQEDFDSDDTFFIWNDEKTLFSDLMGDEWARIVQFIALVQHIFQCKGTGRRRACCPC